MIMDIIKMKEKEIKKKNRQLFLLVYLYIDQCLI
jgi:hypothetical protein